MSEQCWEILSVREQNRWAFQIRGADGEAPRSARVTGPDGTVSEVYRSGADNREDGVLRVPVKHPVLWSSQSPALYTIRIAPEQGPEEEIRTGLREVVRKGQKVFWNGNPVKLFGLVYREREKKDGETEQEHRALLEHDLRLFREAGVNYLRAMKQPYSESLLSLCDELGFLVEQTLGYEEIGKDGPCIQNDPAQRENFRETARQTVQTGRNHPCILLWLAGADCIWGENFRQAVREIRSLDAVRLINFHLPMSIPENDFLPDVWSVWFNAWNMPMDRCYDQMVIFHTPGTDNPIGYQVGEAQEVCLPVLQDAMAPVPYHDLDDLERDPGIHAFWGESIRRFAKALRETEGALGGAVLAAVDDPACGCAGVLDEKHRPKREYDEMKRAFAADPFTVTRADGRITVENRKLRAEMSLRTGEFRYIAVKSQRDEKTDGGDRVYRPVILGGPRLHTGRFGTGAWNAENVSVETGDREVVFTVDARSQRAVCVRFVIHLREDGEIDTEGIVKDFGRPLPHRVKAGIGLDPGGLDEFGILWVTAPEMEKISWLSAAGTEVQEGTPGSCGLQTAGQVEDPERFFAQKFRLLAADLQSRADQPFVRISSDGTQSIRLERVADPAVCLDDRDSENAVASADWTGEWYRVDDAAGLVNPTETMSDQKGAFCTVHFFGEGIRIYGTSDRNRGLFDVRIDGKEAAAGLNEHTPEAYFATMSRGYEKRYHQKLFEITGLQAAEHVCELTVRGEHCAPSQGNWVSVDSFEIVHPSYPERLLLYVNEGVNYPRMVFGNYTRRVFPEKDAKVRSALRLIPPERDNAGGGCNEASGAVRNPPAEENAGTDRDRRCES